MVVAPTAVEKAERCTMAYGALMNDEQDGNFHSENVETVGE